MAGIVKKTVEVYVCQGETFFFLEAAQKKQITSELEDLFLTLYDDPGRAEENTAQFFAEEVWTKRWKIERILARMHDEPAGDEPEPAGDKPEPAGDKPEPEGKFG